MMMRYALFMALYMTAVYVGSDKMLMVTDVLLSQGNVSVLDKQEIRVKPRTFSRSEIKLVSSDPDMLNIATDFESEQSLSNLFYDPSSAGSQQNENSISEVLDMLQKRKAAAESARMREKVAGAGAPPPPPEDIKPLEVFIDAVFDNGVIVNGRFVGIGDKLMKDNNHQLLGTDVAGKLLQVKQGGRAQWVEISKGKLIL